MHYSRIKTYTDCHHRFYLKYIQYPRWAWPQMFFSDYGTFMHALLADFYSGNKTSEECHTAYLTGFRKNIAGAAPSYKVFENYFRDGAQCLKNLAAPNGDVVEVETMTKTPVAGVPFQGIIDLLEREPNGVLVIIDHKSRNLSKRSSRSKPTKSDQNIYIAGWRPAPPSESRQYFYLRDPA